MRQAKLPPCDRRRSSHRGRRRARRALPGLLIRHNKSGMRQYPGGHLGPDEDPAQMAQREVLEEAGATRAWSPPGVHLSRRRLTHTLQDHRNGLGQRHVGPHGTSTWLRTRRHARPSGRAARRGRRRLRGERSPNSPTTTCRLNCRGCSPRRRNGRRHTPEPPTPAHATTRGDHRRARPALVTPATGSSMVSHRRPSRAKIGSSGRVLGKPRAPRSGPRVTLWRGGPLAQWQS